MPSSVVSNSSRPPFIGQQRRRDILFNLARSAADQPLAEETLARPRSWGDGVIAKDYKDGKDQKDYKDGKDGKDAKEYKDGKDQKDFKDGKDAKEYKDGKDQKDFKDSKDSYDGLSVDDRMNHSAVVAEAATRSHVMQSIDSTPPGKHSLRPAVLLTRPPVI